MPLIKVNESVNAVFSVMERFGNRAYPCGPVSFLEHSLQTATIARNGTDDEELVLAAFFHDIGHFCNITKKYDEESGVINHEQAGAQFLALHGFSARIVALVQNHVLAKRYLTYKHPDYYLSLTEKGKESLEYQGGPLCMEEAFQFEAHPMFHDLVRLRKWDELSKTPGVTTLPLHEFRYMAMYHLILQENKCTDGLVVNQH